MLFLRKNDSVNLASFQGFPLGFGPPKEQLETKDPHCKIRFDTAENGRGVEPCKVCYKERTRYMLHYLDFFKVFSQPCIVSMPSAVNEVLFLALSQVSAAAIKLGR